MKTMKAIVCHICGRRFGALRSDAKYCSASCKSKAQRQRRKRRGHDFSQATDADLARLLFLNRYAPSAASHCYSLVFSQGMDTASAAIYAGWKAVLNCSPETFHEMLIYQTRCKSYVEREREQVTRNRLALRCVRTDSKGNGYVVEDLERIYG